MAAKLLHILGGTRKGTRLDTPPDLSVRPMLAKVRGAIMNILAQDVPRAAVLDVFAGTGSLGLEALSRGATHAVFLESDPHARRLLAANVERLRFGPQTIVVDGDGYRPVAALPREATWPFDVVFFDPPYPDLEAPGGPERLAAAIADLAGAGRLSDEPIVVVHLPVRDLAERIVPPGLELVDQRVYGRTEIAFLAPTRD